MRCANALIIGLAALLPLVGGAAVARADIDPLSGIDFVTIDHANNAPWPGGGPGMNNFIGRGSVGYEYRIGKYEVTTAQWAEFFSAAYDRPQSEWLPHIPEPTTWGAVRVAGTVPGGRRYVVPAGREMWGVGGITWRTAAIFCNWLHNGKGTARESFLSGAYDVSTFGFQGNIFTDQLTRSAGAKYFIPTLDESIKASHYSPDRYGPGLEGWWLYNHCSDVPAIPGLPGEITPDGPAQANYGGWAPVSTPLGSYGVTSPWGLYDTSGATKEWLEEVFTEASGLRRRGIDGSNWISGSFTDDAVWRMGTTQPNTQHETLGFRVAMAVPSPGSFFLTIVVGSWALVKPRRRQCARSSSLRQ